MVRLGGWLSQTRPIPRSPGKRLCLNQIEVNSYCKTFITKSITHIIQICLLLLLFMMRTSFHGKKTKDRGITNKDRKGRERKTHLHFHLESQLWWTWPASQGTTPSASTLLSTRHLGPIAPPRQDSKRQNGYWPPCFQDQHSNWLQVNFHQMFFSFWY